MLTSSRSVYDRQDTRALFYHGYDSYLTHAFPEDELKPLSCKPQTRNRDHPADIGLNDVLGNYSLTLIDSLSTLAVLASAEKDNARDGQDALRHFQHGVEALVNLYGDGGEGTGRCGSRTCGFDLDSKVQVFETNIRGVGGLLSAHLFAIGELPIRGYEPARVVAEDGTEGVRWEEGFVYDGQLLRLAHDLGRRLLPAFSTATDLPYPRVNLRYGIPFYQDAEAGVCHLDGTSTGPHEITETCAAGAGSLVLEFTTLSRLTGDERFEQLAKKAFWAVWNRRSAIGLVGGGIDAESGQWTLPPLAGIGAGIDSFFEYSLKSHILLSNLPYNTSSTTDDNPAAFLQAWEQAHAALKHHVHRSPPQTGEQHPYYAPADLLTGAPRYSWVDNLSAYYPGLLALAGDLSEATESHLLYAALWTRYAALPERWHVHGAFVDPNFRHWAGRPEFVESTYYLFQATKDPWFLHVGEMVLRDVRRRCWTPCGWAGLADVGIGVGGSEEERREDRMESFFLGEFAKYLYLLFDEGHPLNALDGAWVFSTEGHPLVIPRSASKMDQWRRASSATPTAAGKEEEEVRSKDEERKSHAAPGPTCPAVPPPLPLTVSHVANRADLFHAAALAQLHLVPVSPARSSPLLAPWTDSSPGISLADVRSPTNYSFYPWTLPPDLVPAKGMSGRIASPVVSTLTFPNLASAEGGPAVAAAAEKGLVPLGALQKVLDGVLINSLSNIRLNMVQQPKSDGYGGDTGSEFRVHGIANWALGRDEKVLLSREAMRGVWEGDPHFTRVKDLEMVDLIVDVPAGWVGEVQGEDDLEDVEQEFRTEEWEVEVIQENGTNATTDGLGLWDDIEAMLAGLLSSTSASSSDPKPALPSANAVSSKLPPSLTRHILPAILPTGAGAAPLPPSMNDNSEHPILSLPTGHLPFRHVFFLDDTLCTHLLPASIAKSYSILIIKRGDCSFNDKLTRIPAFAPTENSLQLVIVLSIPEAKAEAERLRAELIRPLLDQTQRTPSGLERRHPIAMVMVDGGKGTLEMLRRAARSVGAFDGAGKLVELQRQGQNDGVSGGERSALGVKRRYWFESMGVPIGNLIML